MKGKLLIVDDDEAFGASLAEHLQEEYEIARFTDPEEAVGYLRENQVDVVLTDLVMPKIGGMKILQIVKESPFDTDVIVMTAFAKVENAVEAMKKGAYDYIIKPFTADELALHLAHVFEKRKLFEENLNLKKIVDTKYRPGNIIGESEAMLEVYRSIEVLAQKDATVLITGESGTGKELVARALHFSGKRKGKKFVAINCAAVPETLLESELFGYTKGAFSGAGGNKKGLFEYAEGGSIFLDEIADAPPAIQAKLLRVLQEKNVRPIGGSNEIAVDVRVICATNKDLRQLIQDDRFREDLYYRINVVSVHLPSLRERRDDIHLLAKHFTDDRKKIHPRAAEVLSQYSWPGNVRELKNVIERAVTMSDNEVIMPDDLQSDVLKMSCLVDECGFSYSDARKRILDEFNRSILNSSLLKCCGNVSKAAAELRLDRGNFQRLLRRYQISPGSFKENDNPDNPD